MKYRILFLGYWNLDDGLTHSTIFPHLRILKDLSNVEYLHFANTQREDASKASKSKLENLCISYTELRSKNIAINHINKVYDFVYFPALIKKICNENKINMILSRGAPAGSLAYLSTKKSKIPFIVESFEPHADYMRAAGEWKFFDPRYLFQKYWERKQKNKAHALITVSENYKHFLINQGVSIHKVYTAPCAVDSQVFYRSIELKQIGRRKLEISLEATVGIYAGKFGGLYLEDEAFKIFKQAFSQIKNFHLLVLTNTDKTWLKDKINEYSIPSNRIHIKYVPYEKVVNFLNIADFGFALYKSTAVSPFLSPVKLGEYWACGLPVLLTANVGDEKNWISIDKLGEIWDQNDSQVFKSLLDISHEGIIRKGKEKRSMKKVINIYNQIFH